MIPDVIEHLADIPGTFGAVRRVCHPGTRVVLTCVNPLWAPVLHLAERLKMKMPEGDHRWLPKAGNHPDRPGPGFHPGIPQGRILLPKRIPVVSYLLNRLAEKSRMARPGLHDPCVRLHDRRPTLAVPSVSIAAFVLKIRSHGAKRTRTGYTGMEKRISPHRRV